MDDTSPGSGCDSLPDVLADPQGVGHRGERRVLLLMPLGDHAGHTSIV